MDSQFFGWIDTPIGWLEICTSLHHVRAIRFVDELPEKAPNDTGVLEDCKNQLEEYFKGNRTSFDFPFELSGTDFQKSVWNMVLTIPFSETRSYGEIAQALGNANLMRAVGLANGKNPLPIVIPCHRVLGSNNKLVGYGGGLERKDWLLKHEIEGSRFGTSNGYFSLKIRW
jgi:methylated-DNA-[protein]-cysteine S-methyltransferase